MRTGPRQGVHAQAHSYTPAEKGRGLLGAFLSTTHTGTGTGSEGGPRKEYAAGFQIVAGVLGVATFTALAVHTYDTDKAATEIKRIEGDRKVSEQFWKAQVERYKYDLDLAHNQNYAPYQAAILEKLKKSGGNGGPQEEEKKD